MLKDATKEDLLILVWAYQGIIEDLKKRIDKLEKRDA